MTKMDNNKLGCLGGGIFEIESLADYLTERGYIAACPELKGHTGLDG